MSIKKLFTKEDILNELKTSGNDFYENSELYEFEKLFICKKCFFVFEDLRHSLGFTESQFDNVNFNKDFFRKNFFYKCALIDCSVLEKTRAINQVIEPAGKVYFRDCFLNNFLWEGKLIETVVFHNSTLVDSTLAFSGTNMLSIFSCTFFNSIFKEENESVTQGKLTKASIINSSFTNCNITELEISNKANFYNNTFINCSNQYLCLSNYENNNFINMILKYSIAKEICSNTFVNVIFSEVCLENCNMSGSIFRNCNLTTSSVYGLTLPEAYKNEIRLTDEQLKHVTFV